MEVLNENNIGYKETKLGWIPKDWGYVTLNSVMDLLTDFESNGSFADVKANVTVNNEIDFAWYVRATDLENDTPLKNVKYVDEHSYNFLKKTSLHGDEVLVTKRGEIGKVYYFNKVNKNATLTPNLYLLKLNNDINSKFLFYFLKSYKGFKLLNRINASTTMGALYKDDVKKLKIPLPPIKEQQKIAAILSKWDELIGQQTELIAAKEKRKKGLMKKLLTGEVRFSEFKGEWEEVKLSDVSNIVMGQSPSSNTYNTNDEGLPLIQGNADITNRKTINRIWTSIPTKIIEAGDIIMTVRAPVGAVGVASFRSCIGRGVCAINNHNVNSKFLLQTLISFELKWKVFEQGSTFTAVNSSDIRNLVLYIPTNIKEQEKIASTLTSCDIEIESLKDELESIQKQKKGLMQQLLTGKIRVKGLK